MPERLKKQQSQKPNESRAACISAESSGKRDVDLKTIWNYYIWLATRPTAGEDEKSKWLDIFLCKTIWEFARVSTKRPIETSSNVETSLPIEKTLTGGTSSNVINSFHDDFLRDFCDNVGPTCTSIASRLVAVLAIELRHLCLCFETYKDVRPLRRYVFEGRGWKILYLLSRIEVTNPSEKNWISSLNPTGSVQSATDLTIKDLVELLLNLFQLAMQNQGPVHSSGPVLRPRSAVDYWEDALQTSATKKDAVEVTKNNKWVVLPEANTEKVIKLWSDLSAIYSGRRHRRFGSQRQRPTLQEISHRRKRLNPRKSSSTRLSRKDTPAGFLNSAVKPNTPSNLYNLEPHFRSRSTDSEMEAAAAFGTDNPLLKSPVPQNPMDFEYFEKLVKSEDEARHQMDWLSSLKNGFAGITSFRSNQPTVADSLAPDHSNILTQPVPETQFCLLICHILQNIASVEIRSRNLKTSYELSLILTQFACDELSVLSKGTTNCHVSQSSRHELQIALVNLAQTALAEVQFNDDYLTLLQKNNIIGLCLNVLCDCLGNIEHQNSEIGSNDSTKLIEAALLATSLLNIVRTFHVVSSKTISNVDGNKNLSFVVCNIFVDENGTMAVEKIIQMLAAALFESIPDVRIESTLKLLLKETGDFLSAIGVCEVELSDSASCSKRSVQCLTSLYASLAKLAKDLFVWYDQNPGNSRAYFSVFEVILDALDLTNSVPCLHPVVAWENLLPLTPFFNDATKADDFSHRQKLSRQIFLIVETSAAHFSDVTHPASSKWRFTKLSGSLSDSDSAFYASDASENQNSVYSNIQISRLQYLSPYTQFLSTYFDDFDESTFLRVRETLNHVTKVLCVATATTKVEILAAVFIPSLEARLQRILTVDSTKSNALKIPTESDQLLVQQILLNIRHLIKSKEALNYCRQQRLFQLIMSARHIDGLREDIFRFAFHFVDQELQLMNSATSLESLTVWSGIEVSADENEASDQNREIDVVTQKRAADINDEEVCQAKTIYRAFSSNATLNDVLMMLEAKSEGFVTANDVEETCLIENTSLWQLQVRLVRNSENYRSFFVQRDLLCLLNQVSRRCLHHLTNQLMTSPDHDIVQSLIDLAGTIITLLVLLDRPDTTLRKEHHYLVKSDVTPQEILERCLQVMSDVILDEVYVTTVCAKDCQMIINRLFAASTIGQHNGSIPSTPGTNAIKRFSITDGLINYAEIFMLVLEFPVDVLDPMTLQVTSSNEYDADDSASTSNEDNEAEASRAMSVTSYSAVVNDKVIKVIVDIIVGLGKKEKFDRVVEYGLAKLSTLCRNVKNLKLFANANLSTKLLDGLGHILTRKSNGDTLALTLLKLITILSSHKLARHDFRTIVAFFKTCPALTEDNLAIILDHLHQVVSCTSSPVTDRPSAFLNFCAGGDVRSSSPNSILRFSLPMTESDLFSRTEFSVSFWMRPSLKKASSKDHVFSIGTPDLLLEVLTDSSTMTIRAMASDNVVIGCATFTTNFDKKYEWHHIVINCSTKMVDKLAEIQLKFNTVVTQKLLISLKSVLGGNQTNSENENIHLNIGPKCEEGKVFESDFAVGNVVIFHNLQVDETLAATLFALGPDCSDFTPCPYDVKNVFFKRLLTENPKSGAKVVLPIMENNSDALKSNLATLRQHLLLLFEAKNFEEISFYKIQKENSKSGSGGIFDTLYNVAKSTTTVASSTSSNAKDHHAAADVIRCQPDERLGDKSAERPWKFSNLVMSEGGIASLLLLLARTVELGLSDACIASALDIVFQATFSSCDVFSDAMRQEAVLLVTRILRSEICRAGLLTVTVLFKYCLTEPVIRFDERRSIFQFCYESKALICNARLFEAVFDCWKMWSKDSSSIDHEKSTNCMEAVLKSCAILLRDDHPFRQFNVEIFRKMCFVKKVAFVLKSDTENVETSNASVVFQIVDLLSSLVGSPPDLTVVRDLMSMVLLLHDTSQTFVAHSRSNFYYLLNNPDDASTTSTTAPTTWPRSRSFGGGFLRRTLNSESKNGLLKHSNSYPTVLDEMSPTETSLDETSLTSPGNSTSKGDHQVEQGLILKYFLPYNYNGLKEDVGDSMAMDEDYMFNTVNVDDVHSIDRGIKSVDVDKLKQTLATIKTKRERQQERPNIKKDKSSEVVKPTKRFKDDIVAKTLFERSSPWGLNVGNNNDAGDNWNGGSHVIDGVLNILFTTLQNLPDSLLTKVVGEIILPEYLLVLCNHLSPSVRNQSVRLLWQYISRTHKIEAHGYRMLKQEGYLLLANQLHQFEASEAVIDACLSIVHNRAIVLEECPEIPSHLQVTIRTPGLVPILALLPKSVDNVALAHSLILHVHELCAKVSGLLMRSYKSIGLFESLCKTLRSLSLVENRWTDVAGHDSREILFSDLHDFFRLIALRFVTTNGTENFRTVEEFLLLMLHMLWNEQDLAEVCTKSPERNGSDKKHKNVITAFRRAVCVIVEEALTDVEARMSQIEAASGVAVGRRSSDYDVYSGNLFPLEEVTDLLMRTVSPRGSVNDEEVARRRRYRRQTSSTVSGSVTGRNLAFWNRSPDSVKLATRTEIVDRFGNLMEFAVDFITENEPTANGPDETEENFMFSIVHSLMAELQDIIVAEKTNSRPKTLFSSARSLRAKLLTLINFCLFPEMAFRVRVKILRLLHNHSACEDILENLFRHHPDQHRLLVSFIRRLVADSKNREPKVQDETETEDCKSFYSSLEAWNLVEPTSPRHHKRQSKPSSPRSSSGDDESTIFSDDDDNEIVTTFKSQLKNHRLAFRRRCRTLVAKTLGQYDELTSQVTSKAVEVTKIAMKAQDEERKKFMVNIRDTLSEKVRARQLWQHVIERATHERGIWHFPDFYPNNWRLDEIEGAQRMRIRTERFFSDVPDKYYLPGSKPKTRKPSTPPFSFLLQAPSGMSGVIIAQLSSSDRIRHMDQCTLVLPREVAGEVLVSDHSVYFVENSTDETGDVISIAIKLEDVREYHLRWWQLNDCAVELFLSDGCTRFLVFADRPVRNNFVLYLSECQPRLSNGHPEISQITKLWQDGTLTNFDYLMQLNKLAGRTFNDLMQYPAFPFILSDYSSQELDLTNPKSFRNLRKPISVQDPDKEERYISNYRALSDELSRSHELSCPSVGPFHYGSHYSNTGVVLHYLVRLPPFTSMFLRYQDGNFDLADRTFHSLESAWELASGRSSSDVKELIPDLFYLPELLTNSEGFNLGIKQNGDKVDGVILPVWAKDSPRLFIKIHRQALESHCVRETLNHWIDLVFGFKQSGPAAVEAINVFHPATYYGFDLNSIADPVQRKARATMIKTYGQTPKQLFKSAHPMVHKGLTSARKRSKSSSPDSSSIPRVLDHIIGLQWGSYVGSPSQKDPVIVWSTKQTVVVKKLVSAMNNEVYGLAENSALIVKQNRESSITPFASTNVLGACLITWSNTDRHLKVRLKKNSTTEPILPIFSDDVDDKLTTVNVSPDDAYIWLGFESGKILTVRYTFKHRDLALQFPEHQNDGLVTLYAHRSAVNNISSCVEFGIAVSASDDATCVVWDLRKPSYVRSVQVEFPAKIVTISRTSGDFAVVSHPVEDGQKFSTLSLFTINGNTVATRNCEPPIDAITFSASPEGLAVNVLATGHRTTGVIRLWNSWDLTPVRDIDTKFNQFSIIALAFSFDNQNLFAANSAGDVIIFEKSDVTGLQRPPKYLNLTEM